MSLRSERMIQDERGTRPRATRFYETQVEDHLTSSMQDFIRRQQMVFVATADASGACDCSPRFGGPGMMTVVDRGTLAYPEFRGNGVFASLGNISENSHIGLLFLDFLESTVGLHVNGTAERRPPADCPTGVDGVLGVRGTSASRLIEQWVYIRVQEAYIHCSKHVPRFQAVAKEIQWGTDDPKRKSSDYFRS